MDTAQFNRIIMETCISRCKPAFIFLVISTLLFIINSIYYIITKNNNSLSLLNILNLFKNRLTTKEEIALDVVGIFAMLILLAWTIIPAYTDISEQQYICVWGQYTYVADNQKNIFSNGRVRVNTEEDEFYLELPVGSTETFPLGTQEGFICYGDNSKVLLSFSKTGDGSLSSGQGDGSLVPSQTDKIDPK